MTAESNSLYPLQRQGAVRAGWVTVWAAWKGALGGGWAKKSRLAGSRLGGVPKAIYHYFALAVPKAAVVHANGPPVAFRQEAKDGQLLITLEAEDSLVADQKLEVMLT